MIFLADRERNVSNLPCLQFKHWLQNPMEIHAIHHVNQNSTSVSQDLPLATAERLCNIVGRVFHVVEYFLGGKAHHDAHINEKPLTDAQEEMLANWIKSQGHRGIPMTYISVAQCAGVISGWEVGQSWPKRFCKRHPDL